MTAKTQMTENKQEPWERENPKHIAGQPAHHLSPAAKASAKRAAKQAGRPYPNLVDNMRAASKSESESKSKSKSKSNSGHKSPSGK